MAMNATPSGIERGLLPSTQPDWQRPLQDFHTWRDTTRLGSGPSYFIPLSELRKYFTDDTQRKIIQALYSTPKPVTFDRPKLFRDYIKVFAILLSIGHGQHINLFLDWNSLRDSKLPFEVRPQAFPLHPDFWPEFEKEQWMFSVEDMRYNKSLSLSEQQILPIISKVELKQGGGSTTYKIEILEHYNYLNREHRDEKPRTNTFVLKTYNKDKFGTQHFEKELNGYLTLRQHTSKVKGLVNFYGSFEQCGNRNIILEYANLGTLEEFIKHNDRPSKPEDISEFWHGICNIMYALHRIYEVPSRSNVAEEFLQGWHHDIDPQNILVDNGGEENKYKSRFMLADLGLSVFKKKSRGKTKATYAYGTRRYGAPELYSLDESDLRSQPVTDTADVWSVGCVMSEVATWLAFGRDGLVEYEKARRQETFDHKHFRDHGSFHDGQKVLRSVKYQHDLIRRGCGRLDNLTPKIIEIINSIFTNARPTATHIYERIHESLNDNDNEKRTKRSSTLPIRPTDSPQTFPLSSPWLEDRDKVFERPQTLSNAYASPVTSYATDNSSHNEHGFNYNNEQLNQSPPESPGMLPEQTSAVLDSGSSSRHPESHSRRSLSSATVGPQTVTRDIRRSTERPFTPQTTSLRDKVESANNGLESPQALRSNSGSPQIEESLSAQAGTSDLGKQAAPSVPLSSKADKPKLPHLSLEDASSWYQRRKGTKSQESLPHINLTRNQLQNRDYLFLLDNSYSMSKHWSEVLNRLSLLGYIAKEHDTNGVDMYFTICQNFQKDCVKNCKKTKNMVESAKIRKPQSDSSSTSVFDEALRSLLEAYTNKFKATAKNEVKKWFGNEPRPLGVYIFTDGIWQSKSNPVKPIKNLIKMLDNYGKTGPQVGIQFIQFGNDPKGTKRLQYLDSKLKKAYSLESDIIDTEPSTGDVYKMLLGAVNRDYDDDDGQDPGTLQEWKDLFDEEPPYFKGLSAP